MKIITERDRIRTVADRWSKQYGIGTRWEVDPVKQGILQSLELLGKETCRAADVNEIIGNDTWTCMRCDECKKNTTWTIQLGERPGYCSRTANICRACFDKAIALVNPQSKL